VSETAEYATEQEMYAAKLAEVRRIVQRDRENHWHEERENS
jgi:hypothetical protein